MHSFEYEYNLETFNNIWPKNNARNLPHNLRNNESFVVPHVRIELFRRFPLYSFPQLWNNLNCQISMQPHYLSYFTHWRTFLVPNWQWLTVVHVFQQRQVIFFTSDFTSNIFTMFSITPKCPLPPNSTTRLSPYWVLFYPFSATPFIPFLLPPLSSLTCPQHPHII